MKKYLTFVIIFLLFGIYANPSLGIIGEIESYTPITNGNTLYVGGSEFDNYTSIQDAIDNSSNGDTVYVYDDSSPYYENVIVNKKITLKGENKETTIIDGSIAGFVVLVLAYDVTITGFRIINSGTKVWGFAGIGVNFSSNCQIIENIIEDNHYGIHVHYSSYCSITRNIFDNNYYMGIAVGHSNFPHISKNIVTNTSWFGISINFVYDTLVCEMNHIEGIGYTGIFLSKSDSNIIRNNNFIRNKHNAIFLDSNNNTWSGNYWNRPRILPKIIFGRKTPWDRFPNLFNFDRNPAFKPYDIFSLIGGVS